MLPRDKRLWTRKKFPTPNMIDQLRRKVKCRICDKVIRRKQRSELAIIGGWNHVECVEIMKNIDDRILARAR